MAGYRRVLYCSSCGPTAVAQKWSGVVLASSLLTRTTAREYSITVAIAARSMHGHRAVIGDGCKAGRQTNGAPRIRDRQARKRVGKNAEQRGMRLLCTVQ